MCLDICSLELIQASLLIRVDKRLLASASWPRSSRPCSRGRGQDYEAEAEAEAWGGEAEAWGGEAEAWGGEAEASHFGLEAEARPRGLTSLLFASHSLSLAR
jgi:hypothetical protein